MAKTANQFHRQSDGSELLMILADILHKYTDEAEWAIPTVQEDWRWHMVFNAGFLHAVALCHDYPRLGAVIADLVQDKRTLESIKIVDGSAQTFWETFGPVLDTEEMLSSLVALVDHPDNRGKQVVVPIRLVLYKDGDGAWDALLDGDKVFPDIKEGDVFGISTHED